MWVCRVNIKPFSQGGRNQHRFPLIFAKPTAFKEHRVQAGYRGFIGRQAGKPLQDNWFSLKTADNLCCPVGIITA